nr:MAG TPA: hypothetical protein [Caudoviricetes sp.]
MRLRRPGATVRGLVLPKCGLSAHECLVHCLMDAMCRTTEPLLNDAEA